MQLQDNKVKNSQTITPPSESASEEDIIQNKLRRIKTSKNLALIANVLQETLQTTTTNLRTFLKPPETRMWIILQGGPVVQQFRIQCFNCKEFSHYAKECRKPKRMNRLMNKRMKHIKLHGKKIQEVPNATQAHDARAMEQNNTKLTIMMYQNAVECDDERVALANLIANLKLDVNENKKIQKQLKKANATLTQELTECKSILAKQENTRESNSIADSCRSLKINRLKFGGITAFNDRTVDYDKLEQKHDELVKPESLTSAHYEGLVNEKQVLKDVNARLRKTNVVPISTRTPKRQQQSVATPYKKTVASESTITSSKSYYRMLYKKTSKAWKWWIAQQCPSAYKWVPKTTMKWVPKVRNETVPKRIVQLILFIVDSGCTKHMTGNLSLLCNFVEKYLGTVRFGNDQFAPILGYGDLVQGNITIKRVYYVEASPKLKPWFLATKSFPPLNFDYTTCFQRRGCIGLPKLKYVKDQLCSSCEVSKAKRTSFKSKTVPSLKGRLNLLHMDLCGPMRVASINGKKYILVIVDDYSRYTWTLFLRSKDETPEVLKDFLTMIQRNLQALVISVRTDRGTEFLNKTLNAFFKEEGIEHQTSTP
ncbi:retrovirus-related pol polyprotein from transposon TNT 1-94 [Tanacetum coccineum]